MFLAGILLVAAVTGAWQAVGVVTVAVATATGAYLVARRTASGSVNTSDAATLFEESRQIRIELRTEVAVLRERVAVVERENRDLRVQNIEFQSEVNDVRAENEGLKTRVRSLEAEVHELRGAHG